MTREERVKFVKEQLDHACESTDDGDLCSAVMWVIVDRWETEMRETLLDHVSENHGWIREKWANRDGRDDTLAFAHRDAHIIAGEDV